MIMKTFAKKYLPYTGKNLLAHSGLLLITDISNFPVSSCCGTSLEQRYTAPCDLVRARLVESQQLLAVLNVLERTMRATTDWLVTREAFRNMTIRTALPGSGSPQDPTREAPQCSLNSRIASYGVLPREGK